LVFLGIRGTKDAKSKRLPMKKILVIDDEEWLREMIHLALKQKGFDVSNPITAPMESRKRGRSCLTSFFVTSTWKKWTAT